MVGKTNKADAETFLPGARHGLVKSVYLNNLNRNIEKICQIPACQNKGFPPISRNLSIFKKDNPRDSGRDFVHMMRDENDGFP